MERPILFSTEMVKAIWKDRKSKTRRLNGLKEINKNVDKWNFDSMGVILESGINRPVAWFENKITSEQIGIICPYEVGMTLWVRETWQLLPSGFDEIPPEYRYIYKATDDLSEECTRWRPAIHMPRTACRLRLKITGIRVER
ncbi:MAG: hypothetical protein PHD54_14325, partial [Desulfuromonadaceae bacterium]|nr:hypothetical protein [Desulfuromonadaceae bacterium]